MEDGYQTQAKTQKERPQKSIFFFRLELESIKHMDHNLIMWKYGQSTTKHRMGKNMYQIMELKDGCSSLLV
jgi:hypothetical protein